MKIVNYVIGLYALLCSVMVFANDEAYEFQLAHVSQDVNLAVKDRVNATLAMQGFEGANAFISIARASRDEHASMRLAAITAASYWSTAAKWDLFFPLVNDVDERVKKAALQSLILEWTQMSEPMQLLLNEKMVTYQLTLPQGLESQLEIAWIEQSTDKLDSAEKRLVRANADYQDVRIVLGLAKVQASLGKLDTAKLTLMSGFDIFPDSGALHYQVAVLEYQQSNFLAAQEHFKLAHRVDPNNASYSYAYALSIRDQQTDLAVALLEDAYQHSGLSEHLYAKCDVLLSVNRPATACLNALSIITPVYVVEQLTSLYEVKT